MITDLIRVERSIRLIRGDKVILDGDLTELYGIETRSLIQPATQPRRRNWCFA